MSELLPIHEQEKLLPEHGTPETPERQTEQAHEARHEHQEQLAQIRQSIEQTAVSGKEVNHTEHEDKPGEQPGFITRELKLLAFKRNLARVRQHLNRPDKLASKVIHQPLVAKVSDMAEDTVARPSGLLGGGTIALLGSFTLLYMAKHYGFEYNFLAFFLLFASGFLLGILGEFGMKLAKR